jgi:hypothetical protein
MKKDTPMNFFNNSPCLRPPALGLFKTLLFSLAIAAAPVIYSSALAIPLMPPAAPVEGAIATPPPNLPVCYLQIQGGAPQDVSRICGKKTNPDPTKTPTPPTAIAPVNTTGSTPPPPDFSSAATAKQCNFVDANGKPCPKKESTPPVDSAKPTQNQLNK